jgi:hypothetical protein
MSRRNQHNVNAVRPTVLADMAGASYAASGPRLCERVPGHGGIQETRQGYRVGNGGLVGRCSRPPDSLQR